MKECGWRLVVQVGLVLTLLVCGWPVMPVHAASTWMVTKVDDSNDGTCDAADCSLREAIAVAVDGDTISFNGDYTIYLNSQLELTQSLTLDGSGRTIIISGDSDNDGSANVRVFKIATGKNVTMNHISVVNGSADNGGGIYNAGTLTLQDSTLSDNTTSGGGGAIRNVSGSLTLIRTTVVNNTGGDGGGIFNSYGSLTLQNSTVSGNRASAGNGGGISSSNGAVTLKNSTLSDNAAAVTGGGIYHWGNSLALYNTIIANSTGGDCILIGGGSISSNVNNLIEDASCKNNSVGFVSGDPTLGPLDDNGGQTRTHALLPGSTAIEAGDNASCLATDQRTVSRPQMGRCDIGAYEAAPQPVLRLTKSVTPTSDVAYAGGVVTYTIVLKNVSTVSDSGVTLTDTLPAGMDFVKWVTNAGATVNGSQIAWNGTLTGQATITLVFQAAHSAGLENVNTAVASDSTQLAQASATSTSPCPNTLTVSNSNDSGPGSLRQAIADICPGKTIDFDGDYTIHLTGPLTVSRELTIDGSNHSIALSGDSDDDGNGDVRVFHVNNGSGTVTLKQLSIVNGSAPGGDPGGGIYNEGTLSVVNSALSGNSAQDGGGISNHGALTVQNSTFSGNSAQDGGSISNHGALTVQNSTFSGNLAQNGGGIANYSTLNLYNTIIADSATGSDCVDASGTVTADHNLIEASGVDACGLTGGAAGNIIGPDPLLGALGAYGGEPQTFALLPGSQALDAGQNCLTTDQRGASRVGICDIGAFESQGFTLAKTGGDHQSAVINTTFTNPLIVSVTANNPLEPVDGGQITFTPPTSGASATLVTSPAAISGGAASVTATANGTAGPYNVNANGASGVNFALTNQGLTLSGQVRNDADHDGDLMDVENGLTGAQLSLWSDSNGDGDPTDELQVGSTYTTDATGNYTFTNLSAGKYVVVETNPGGYTSSADAVSPNDDRIPVVIATTNRSGNDFLDFLPLDFGDLPDSYGTRLASNGARHIISAIPTVYLGSGVDVDLDGAPTTSATGDGSSGTDDENGVTFQTPILPGSSYTIQVTAGSSGFLNAWIDFDGNGAFDAGEQIAVDMPLSASPNTLTLTAPNSATPFAPTLYSRFRFTGAAGQALTPTGLAPDGEVEDYALGTIIGDFVWNDLNGNGLQDAGEPGLSGVSVQLTPPATVDLGHGPGVAVTTTTDANGNYAFVGLTPGVAYTVSIPSAPTGVGVTLLNQGSDPAKDANDPAGVLVTAVFGATNDSIDFGYRSLLWLWLPSITSH